MTVQNARIADGSGEIDCVWFNQPWVAERLKPGVRVRLIGTLRRGGFSVRSHDVVEEASGAELVPVYPASEDVTSRLHPAPGRGRAAARARLRRPAAG